MVLSKFSSGTTLSLAGVVLLVGGLGISILAAGQQQDNRSKASGPAIGAQIASGTLNLNDGSGAGNPGVQAPATHIGGLTPGVTYKIVASGYWRYQKNVNWNSLTDLQFDDWLQGNDGCFCHPVSDGAGGRLDFNGAHALSSDPYNGSHTYTYYWTADRDYLDIFVWDTHYHDNVSIQPVTFVMTVHSVPLPPPTNVTASCSDSGTKFTVNWTPVSGESNYYARIHDETTDKEGAYSGVITGSSYSMNNAIPGHKYSYWVHTTNAAGSPYSAEIPTAHTTTVTCPVPPPPAANPTKFNLNLLFHGIGKAGDNKDPNELGKVTGTTNPKLNPRSVLVDVYDFDDNVIIANKEGQVTYDPTFGGYKGTVDMGTTLQSQAYIIKVKLSHSLRGSISRNIIAGTTSAIPVMKLVNGDANNDAKLDILDYNIIDGCVEDLDLNRPAKDCNPTKKLQADIDDDGRVYYFDLNLFLREMSVQEL